MAAAFEHLHGSDRFTIRGDFDAWRQYEVSNAVPRFEPASKAVHKIHGRSATVVGEFVWPDKFELKFEPESQIIEPFFPGVIVTPEERARLVDGIGFDVPDPIEVPPSLITVTASDGQIISDHPDFVARDTSGSEIRKLVLDFISEALGGGKIAGRRTSIYSWPISRSLASVITVGGSPPATGQPCLFPDLAQRISG